MVQLIKSQILLAGETIYFGTSSHRQTRKYVVKNYGFDGQDRLDREWSFLSRLKCFELSCVPYPVFL